MIELLASPSLIYSLLKDAWAAMRGRRRRLTPAQVLELRQKWKPLFEDEIWKTHSRQLRKDVIIRDVKRLDAYPSIEDEKRGISPWFRLALMATYHKGILVFLDWRELIEHEENEWRYTDHRQDERGDINAALIGRIPFENIESVDWEGDEYYGYPHIYCHFDGKRNQPYEDLVFCIERCNPGGRPFYTEIDTLDRVRKLSKELGIASFG